MKLQIQLEVEVHDAPTKGKAVPADRAAIVNAIAGVFDEANVAAATKRAGLKVTTAGPVIISANLSETEND